MAIEFIRILGQDGEPTSYPLREIRDDTYRILCCVADAALSGLVVIRHPLDIGEYDLTPYLSSESPAWCAANVSKTGTVVLRMGWKGAEDGDMNHFKSSPDRRNWISTASPDTPTTHVPEDTPMTVLYGVGDPGQGNPDQGYGFVRHVESTSQYAAFDTIPIQPLPPIQ